MIQLIVGLANPGPDYVETRHNAGAWWVEAVCEQHHISLQRNVKLQAYIGQGEINGDRFRCAIPTTFMNHSGQAVKKLCSYFDISPENLLVAHDEIDFEPGIMKLKTGGGHGGHNGLRDIMPQVGKDFHRIRVGVGHPGNKDQVADFVLQKPNKTDQEKIINSITASLNALPDIIAGNWQAAMNKIHQKQEV